MQKQPARTSSYIQITEKCTSEFIYSPAGAYSTKAQINNLG